MNNASCARAVFEIKLVLDEFGMLDDGPACVRTSLRVFSEMDCNDAGSRFVVPNPMQLLHSSSGSCNEIVSKFSN